MPARPILRVGLVGAGFLARTRARCWNKVHGVDVRLTAVSSGSSQNAERFAKDWGIGQSLPTEELIHSKEVDLVDLCVPNHLHRPLSEAASLAGKQVLCTKPLSAYVGQDLDDPDQAAKQDREHMFRVALADAQAMVSAAEQAGAPLHYGENWIFAPSIQRASQLSRSGGLLLEMHGWEAHSGSHAPYSRYWRNAGGGALIRLASHPIGAMIWLKRIEGLRNDGKPVRVVSVTAETADLTKNPGLREENTKIASGWNEVENWGCIILHFEDGSRGVAHGSDALLGGMQSHLRLLASDHHLECNLSPNDLLRAYSTEDGTFGDEYLMEKLHGQAGWSSAMPDEDWTSGQQGLCQGVAEAAVDKRPSESPGEIGLEVVRVIYGGYVSAHDGRRVDLDAMTSEA